MQIKRSVGKGAHGERATDVTSQFSKDLQDKDGQKITHFIESGRPLQTGGQQQQMFNKLPLLPISQLQLSQKGIDFLKDWEGFEAIAKVDVTGNCTIGYGHKINSGPCTGTSMLEIKHAKGMSLADADMLLHNDIKNRTSKLNTWLAGAMLTQAMYDALLCLTYNAGGAGGSWQTYKQTIAGQYQLAANEFLNIDKAWDDNLKKYVRVRGLTRRRYAEYDMYLNNNYTAP